MRASRYRWADTALVAFLGISVSACAYRPLGPDAAHVLPQPGAQAGGGRLDPPLPLLDPLPRVSPGELGMPKPDILSVSVRDVPLRDLLFAVARDFKLNLDVHPAVDGVVTMNAVNQTLVEILDRLVAMQGIRYEIQGNNLIILPDEPILRHYRIDHINVERAMDSRIGATTAIGGSVGGGGGGGGSSGSASEIRTATRNQFWTRLIENVRDLLRETDRLLPSDSSSQGSGAGLSGVTGALQPSGSSDAGPAQVLSQSGQAGATGTSLAADMRFREAASVIANPEAGLLSVRATHRQHLKVREFLDRVLRQSALQVFIEATVVEVELFDQYQQGINWNLLRDNLSLVRLQPSEILPGGTPASGAVPSVLTWSPSHSMGSWRLDATLRLLESFGNAKVLSSPRLTAANNQPAMLKVTEDIVYFRITFQYNPPQDNTPARVDVSSTPTTVSVGLVLQVVPQIGEGDEVTMVLRPTLTSIKSFVDDPAIPVLLAQARQNINISEVRSQIPQIQTREMESIVKVRSGEVVVLGGLMREEDRNTTDQVPGASQLPFIGEALRYRQRRSSKSELVIFLRPTVVRSGYGSEHLQRLPRSTFERAGNVLPEKALSGPLLWPGLNGGSGGLHP